MRLIKYPSIEQFRSIVKKVRESTEYQGKDSEGKPIYNKNVEYPTLRFFASTKIHGTNASICKDFSTDEVWCQSRENIITPLKDNAGFATFIDKNQDILKIFDIIKGELDLTDETVVVYGEWAGKGIQKGEAVSEIEKSFYIFEIRVIKDDISKWYSSYYFTKTIPHGEIPAFRDIHPNVYTIDDFGLWVIDIDFNNPESIQNDLIKLTLEIEETCPVGKYFGINGVGEGIVLTSYFNGDVIRFKSKGEKHSSSKVKVLNSVDTEKLNSISEFVDYAVTENRLLQGIEQVFTQNSIEPDIKKTREFVR